MASSFMALVYATLNDKGVDTSEMTTSEAVKLFNELADKVGLKKEEIENNKQFYKFKQNKVKFDMYGFPYYDEEGYERLLEEREEFFKKSFDNLEASYSSKEKQMLYSSMLIYTGAENSRRINQYLRGDIALLDHNDKIIVPRITGSLDDAISKFDIKKPIKVFRGLDIIALKQYNVDENNIKSIVGKTINEKGYSSTSLDKDIAEDFRKRNKKATGRPQIMFEVNLPKGKNIGIPTWNVSTYSIEQEILLKRNAGFKITAVDVAKSGKITMKGDML